MSLPPRETHTVQALPRIPASTRSRGIPLNQHKGSEIPKRCLTHSRRLAGKLTFLSFLVWRFFAQLNAQIPCKSFFKKKKETLLRVVKYSVNVSFNIFDDIIQLYYICQVISIKWNALVIVADACKRIHWPKLA